jgi:uroporphyrinogen III methyltransferase/synthase
LQANRQVTDLLDKRQIDWVTVTSSAIASSLVQLFGTRLTHTRLVSISPVTTATLRQRDLEPQVEATSYTMEGVVSAILQDASAAGASSS